MLTYLIRRIFQTILFVILGVPATLYCACHDYA